ncbi:DUF6911 family protein [Ralstonia pseudosolanacearum]|uniref:DUF6911 family protein n=2 Tax=Ralstonia pseudosolanacearum TaxID=1310165 RepID=UPI002675790B|nr:hypothetical protein [Ralstonia pseudosolanacearum]MDO3529647.1 hypothetical protein [Ralstonia pseudosolanacearum]
MTFGGYVIGSNEARNQLPLVINPISEEISKRVSAVSGGVGVLAMRPDPAPEFGPLELTLYAEGGCFLLLLTEISEDSECNVRTLTNEDAASDFVSILGETYPAKAVTSNSMLVCSVFVEFSKVGDVSSGLIN